ncbi:MAG: cytochrome c oxidase subunit II [Ilumatobacter fluminis]|uniref:Cytochrome c oxidase subunit 2 n=1 Tax=Ilumatobacter fluminis TaxID=467091 RepID=A0A4R7HX41_9ACTN|nr:cytochrome c oxidase subunit II [Ilumatobacter fluminis]TDT15029.1 cytochrome c oxidase subunit 2 [Ilumatobacter fluminis]
MTESSPLRSRLRTAALVGVGGVVLASCAQDAPQDTWQPAGSEAQKIHDLQWPIFLIAGIVGLIVMAVVAVVVVKFKDRGQPIPEQSHGKAWLEYLFIALPAVLLAGIAVPTVATIIDLNDTDDADCVINVTGQQWWWEYDYPIAADGSICGFMPTGESGTIVTSGQMVIPTDAKVVIRGTSRDVIHSFWVPRLNGKRDMVPGRVHTWNFNAEQPGIYAGQCAEFCGLSHANMRMEIVALDDTDFQAWIDNQLEPYQSPEEGTLAADGESEFIAQCARCHQVDGLVDADGELVVSNPEDQVYSGAAPNLTNFMTRNTFAGATWDLLNEECRADVWEADPEVFGDLYLEGVTESCLNEIDLKEWLRDAPAKKPMYADAESLEATDGLVRGMPYLALSEDQIDRLVAYLLERK